MADREATVTRPEGTVTGPGAGPGRPGAVAVTGASGFLGSLLVERCRDRGLPVVALSRSPRGRWGATVVEQAFELGADPAAGVFSGVSTVVHCAWDLRETQAERSWDTNVRGSLLLLERALAAGVEHFVFVSSMSAYHGTKQSYGLMKLAVERVVLDHGQHVIRPGLVYGPGAGGMGGTLERFARLPVWPRLGGARQFTVHLDDFTDALERLLSEPGAWAGRVVGLADPQAVDLRTLLAVLADDGRPRPALPVPVLPLRAALRLAETLGVRLPFRSDSLLGLVRPAPCVPGQDVTRALGIAFRRIGAAGPPAPPTRPGSPA